MSTVHVNGIDMFYQKEGKGIPLVCLPGLASTHEVWGAMAPGLRSAYQLIRFDPRGIGRTTSPKEPYSIEQMAADVIGLMDALEIDSAVLMGHSMGTAVALSMASQYPARVLKLVLCNPFSFLRAGALFPFQTNAQLWRNGLSQGALFQIIMPWLFSDSLLANRALVDDMVSFAASQKAVQALYAFENQIAALVHCDVRSTLSKVHQSVLLLAGTKDLLVPAGYVRALAERLSDARLVSIISAHMMIVEQPEQIIEQVKAFI